MKVEELINDASFRNWANGTVQEDCLKWERYLDAHPEMADLLLTSKIMAGGKIFASDKPKVEEIEQEWSVTRNAIRNHNRVRSKKRVLRFAAVAASLAVIVIAALLIVPGKQIKWITLETSPGQISEYLLNDGTKVTLNGNSRLRYPESFDLLSVREVQFEGEAFFEVKNYGKKAPFKVRIKDAEVLVLGTVFNIKSRSKNSVVSLLEGKVEVTSLTHQNHVILAPGQTAAMQQSGIAVYEDDVQSSTSWRNQLWVFEETPLSDVLTDLEESFGVAATIAPNVDTGKAISGKLSTKNLSTLYHALETMLGITIIEKGTNILIKNKAE